MRNFIFSRDQWRSLWITLPYLWYGLMLGAPMIIIFALSVSELRIGAPPYSPLWRWVNEETFQLTISLSNYISVLKDSFYRAAYGNSLFIASISTLLCLVIGYPMAYGISRSKRQMIWLSLAILPFFTSFLVRVYAWISLLSPRGLINHYLTSLGFSPLPLMNNLYAVIIGIVYSYLPFTVFPLYASLSKIDNRLLEAAYDLGCRPLSAFWRITVPLSRAGIISGASLVFIPVVGEYIIPELLGGPTCLTIGRLLWSEFFINRDWPVAATIAVIMIALVVIPMILFEKLQDSVQEESFNDVS